MKEEGKKKGKGRNEGGENGRKRERLTAIIKASLQNGRCKVVCNNFFSILVYALQFRSSLCNFS